MCGTGARRGDISSLDIAIAISFSIPRARAPNSWGRIDRTRSPSTFADHPETGSKAELPQSQWRALAQRGSLFDLNQMVLA